MPPGERARLIERLIISLDIDPAVEEAWAAEVECRNAEIETPIPHEALSVFPYLHVYTVVGEQMRVLAVAHHSRRPDYWRTRR